jgi:hypothetical protein
VCAGGSAAYTITNFDVEAAAEERDPANFDPSVAIRGMLYSFVPCSKPIQAYDSTDYEAINLPTFTCSSRDYVRIKSEMNCDL